MMGWVSVVTCPRLWFQSNSVGQLQKTSIAVGEQVKGVKNTLPTCGVIPESPRLLTYGTWGQGEFGNAIGSARRWNATAGIQVRSPSVTLVRSPKEMIKDL